MMNKLEQLANTDALTSIHNRFYLMENGDKLINETKELSNPITVMMLDLDFFKDVNDKYGHVVGDEILTEFAARISNLVRKYDLFARYGGEEFILVAPRLSFENAKKLADRIRFVIESCPFIYDRHEIAITVSIGTASQRQITKNLKDFIASADEMLYTAKSNGRNRVESVEI